jgi:hypothetical protein
VVAAIPFLGNGVTATLNAEAARQNTHRQENL